MLRRIVITSIAPLFPDAVYGGSQAILSRIAIGLAEAGATIDLICSARPENSGGFDLAAGVRVRPLLRLTGAFPDPYEVPPADLAATARDIAPFLKAAELVYLHADIFHFRDLIPTTTPIVRSFHDFHYETALVSAFAHSADLTIVPSRYVANCIRATLGASGLREMEPVRIIPNGINTDLFTPDGPSDIEGLGPRHPDDLVLLYPHRPDERKGIFEALAVLSLLAASLNSSGTDRRVRLVVPRHLDAGNLPFMARQYAEIDARARDMGLSRSIEYVPWVSQEQMPNFYRYGDITLCLGNIIESFGLTPYESIACGTPAVAVNVGGYRELPDLQTFPTLRRIDHGDHEGAETAIRELAEVSFGATGPPPLPAQFPARFTESQMVSAYVDALLGNPPAPVSRAASSQVIDTKADGRLVLAPWCYAESDAIYDDYAYGRHRLPRLAEFFQGNDTDGALTEQELMDAGIPAHEMAEAVAQNVLIQRYV
ncbi:MAG: glycosyltransferase family 4 protein [Chloroflexi bacterium]|nr:glycosyltransferase family 4 protein [Chloroflexota bacterium]